MNHICINYIYTYAQAFQGNSSYLRRRSVRAVQLNSAFSSLIAVMFLLASLLMAPGCGESNYSNNDTDTDIQAVDSVFLKAAQGDEAAIAAMEAMGASLREHWYTKSDVLYDGLSVIYSPYSGSGGTVVRSGDKESITISLSLVEYNEDIRAYGSVILDEETSLTSHPLEIRFKECQFTADHERIVMTGSGTVTTKTESGTLIQPPCLFTLEISYTSQGIYRCRARIEIINDLNKVAEFNIPIKRSDDFNPISFFESSWGKKKRVFEISYPRKQYSSQTPVTALATEDILKLNISGQGCNRSL